MKIHFPEEKLRTIFPNYQLGRKCDNGIIESNNTVIN